MQCDHTELLAVLLCVAVNTVVVRLNLNECFPCWMAMDFKSVEFVTAFHFDEKTIITLANQSIRIELQNGMKKSH